MLIFFLKLIKIFNFTKKEIFFDKNRSRRKMEKEEEKRGKEAC